MSAQLELIRPLAGLVGTRYAVDEVDAGLCTLRSEDADADAPVRLFVVAGSALPAYQPELDDEQIEELELSAPDDAELYVVVNPAEAGPTLNLLAPIVVNRHTRRGAQLVLDAGRWPLRAALGDVLAG